MGDVVNRDVTSIADLITKWFFICEKLVYPWYYCETNYWLSLNSGSANTHAHGFWVFIASSTNQWMNLP